MITDQPNFDRQILEELMKDAETFIYEVEHVDSIKSQLDIYEWKSRYQSIFDLEKEKIEKVEDIESIRDEGIDKKYIDEKEIQTINAHLIKIKDYKDEVNSLLNHHYSDDENDDDLTFIKKVSLSSINELIETGH